MARRRPKNSFFALNFAKSQFQGLDCTEIDSPAGNTFPMIYFIPRFDLDIDKEIFFTFSISVYSASFVR